MKKNDRKNKNYDVLPGPPMGLVTPGYLEQVAAIIRKHDIPFLKLTGAQRIAIGGHSPEVAEKVWREMGQIGGPQKPVGIHYIQACPGVKWCKYGRKDPFALGRKVEKALFNIPLPAKTKVGISGCAMNCCEGYIRDIGIFGMKKGWTLVFGGNGGGVPRIGDVMGDGLGDDEVISLAARCLEFYRENARKLERTGRLMRRITVDKLRKYVLA